MTTHELKTWPQYFEPAWNGDKPYDVRWDDRGFQRGDQLVLREYDPLKKCDCRSTGFEHPLDLCPRYTGRSITATVGFMTASTPGSGSKRGFNGQGYVVLGLVAVVYVSTPSGEHQLDGPDLSKVPLPGPPYPWSEAHP